MQEEVRSMNEILHEIRRSFVFVNHDHTEKITLFLISTYFHHGERGGELEKKKSI